MMMCPQITGRLRGFARVMFHLVLIPVGFYLAFLIRFDFKITGYLDVLLYSLPFVVVIRSITFGVFGIYRGWLRYSGIPDVRRMIVAVTWSSGLILLSLFLTNQLTHFPRSILLLDWGVTIALFTGARLAVRVWRERTLLSSQPRAEATPILVVGAGVAGSMLIRELQCDVNSGLRPVALVDDDPSKRGMTMHGVCVKGTVDEVAEVARCSGAKAIVIAAPSSSADEMQRIVRLCSVTGIKVRVVPTLRELLEHQAKLSQIRDVQIEDLLGRESVSLDLGSAKNDISGRVVLITGGAGSIGSELARQVAALGPSKLILLEQAESPLYFIHLELVGNHPDVEVVPVVADVVNRTRMTEIFGEYRPDYVFHAAAYKHVPMMEHNVGEAIRNNVFGTLNVAQAAARFGARRFVLISTDKAVRPSSVMGATKRIAERIILGHPTLQTTKTDFRAVRFGNVLGSDGSVIPLFKRQLAKGGPLTVTHKDVTRYFMTIPEAVQLVLTAAWLPEAARRISMLEMGKPVKIVDLAENLIRLSGLRPGIDVHIAITGMRPGEKLHEELMSDVEATIPTAVEKIKIVQTDEVHGVALAEGLDELGAALNLGGISDGLKTIRKLVPECVAPLRDRGVDAATTAVIKEMPGIPIYRSIEEPSDRNFKAKDPTVIKERTPDNTGPKIRKE